MHKILNLKVEQPLHASTLPCIEVRICINNNTYTSVHFISTSSSCMLY